jgi:hypothetical protein
MGQVQSLIAARNYWKWAKESGEIPDMVCYGGLFRQWETAQALGDVMVADGYDRPTLICQKVRSLRRLPARRQTPSIEY